MLSTTIFKSGGHCPTTAEINVHVCSLFFIFLLACSIGKETYYYKYTLLLYIE
jgi:hypothetical protein